MIRRTALERRTPLVARTELKRRTPLAPRSGTGKRRRPISPASPEQRAKVRLAPCVVCGTEGVHPAHLIDRSLVPDSDGDPRRVIPLCPPHHHEYDDGALSLLEHLEPAYRTELAYAVELVGLIAALERITNDRWRVAA